MRIVTRPDFDGIVCAVILYETEHIDEAIYWVEPGEVQGNTAKIKTGDIMANLPFDSRCSLWFDHHISNSHGTPFEGAFKIEPSAARVAFDYYLEKGRDLKKFSTLIEETDKIDSADLSIDEVRYPEKHPYVLLSMTIFNRNKADEAYWNELIQLLRKEKIENVLAHPEVMKKTRQVIDQNAAYKEILKKHTIKKDILSVTDLRSFDPAPVGNRFLVYSLFPDTYVSMRIRYADGDTSKTIVSIGHNIFNKQAEVNIGKLLSAYNGGGHFGAGACSMASNVADRKISEITKILLENKPNE